MIQTTTPNPLLSVVLPVFNESDTVATVIDAVLELRLDGVDLQLVIIESNSTDGTRAIVEKYESHSRVRLLRQDQPRGKGAAVRAGLECASGDIILIQDGDLEYRVSDYPVLLEPILTGQAMFVLGSRHVKGRPIREMSSMHVTSGLLNIAHWVFALLFNTIYRVNLCDPFTMYKVFRRECIEGVQFESNRFDFDFELVAKLIRLGYVPLEVPIWYKSRDFAAGKKVRMFRDPLTWIVALVKFRIKPVRRQGLYSPK